jgi:hypothetical protein
LGCLQRCAVAGQGRCHLECARCCGLTVQVALPSCMKRLRGHAGLGERPLALQVLRRMKRGSCPRRRTRVERSRPRQPTPRGEPAADAGAHSRAPRPGRPVGSAGCSLRHGARTRVACVACPLLAHGDEPGSAAGSPGSGGWTLKFSSGLFCQLPGGNRGLGGANGRSNRYLSCRHILPPLFANVVRV